MNTSPAYHDPSATNIPEVNYHQAPGKLVFIFLTGVFLSASCAVSVIYGWTRSVEFYFAIAFAVMFAAAAIDAVFKLLNQTGPVISISRNGLFDKRIHDGLIPWHAIAEIYIHQGSYRGNSWQYLFITLKPEYRHHIKTNLWMRFNLFTYWLIGHKADCYVTASGTNADEEILYEDIYNYWLRSQNGVPQDHPIQTFGS